MAKSLIQGFKMFRKDNYEGDALMKRLVKDGQSPDYFIISCIDSRSNPGTIFRPEPGTFFAHKAMGAIVRPYKKGTALAAALQFALMHNTTVKEIIVLGHTGCGAIKAMVEKIDDEEISSFVNVAQEGLENAKHRCGNTCTHDELLRHSEEEIVLLSAENLKSYPSVATALQESRVVIRPWLFDMERGELLQYSPDFKEFVPLTAYNQKSENA
jgi:carbonic anhydrase